MVVGVVVAFYRFIKGTANRILLIVVLGWFLLPASLLMIGGIPTYANAKHMTFALPPIFIFAGIGLDMILQRVRLQWTKGIIILFVLIPGIRGIITLHPYEYIYFNEFTGGVSGAYGQYEVEYMCISIKEATEYVNEIAEEGASLMVFGQIQNSVPYARDDLVMESQYSPISKADYAIVCKNWPAGSWDPSDFELVHQVKRGDAILSEVWRRIIPAPG